MEFGGLVSIVLVSGNDLFFTPKTFRSLSNSDLGHLQHSLDSNRLRVPKTLRSTSYFKPLPAVPNATACSFYSNPSSDTPSNGYSETSASSKGNLETSLDSAPSDLDSALMLFGDSLNPKISPLPGEIPFNVYFLLINFGFPLCQCVST